MAQTTTPPTTDLKSEYVDYEVYLQDSFSPIVFANSLVQATNDLHDLDIDLQTSNKRLRYDLDEVEQRITNLTSSNYQDLIAQASSAGAVAKTLPPLRTSLEHINSSYAKLQRDILAPYYNAQKLYTALKRLHSTSGLLRALTWYLYLARQLATLLKPIASPSAVPDNPRSARVANLDAISATDLLQAAQTVSEIRAQIKSEPGLRSLHVIRTHESSLGKVEQKLVYHCQNIIKFYTSNPKSFENDGASIVRTSSPSLSGSTNNIHSGIPAGLDYNTLITHACYSLFLLKPEALASSIQKYHVAQIGASVNDIVRSLSSLNMTMMRFNSALTASGERAKSIATLNKLLRSFDRPATAVAIDSNSDSVDADLSLWDFVSSSLDVTSLSNVYWKDLARNLETQIRDFTHNNSNMVKTIHFKNYPSTKEIVNNLAVKPFNGSEAAAQPEEIKLLVRSLAPLFR